MPEMNRVLVEEIGQVTVVRTPVPTPGPGEVLVHARYVGICGSDTHAAAGQHPLLIPPYTPGHEACGTIAEVGPGVEDRKVGERIILKPNVPCYECVNCVAGRTNACQTLAWIGCDSTGVHQGAMAEYFIMPARLAYPVPDEVDDLQAALVECLATPVHALRLAGGVAGKRVAILGAGTIGLLALYAVRSEGPVRVVVSDLEESKRARALEFGADAVLNGADNDFSAQAEEALGGKADVVIDCVAAAPSVAQAIAIVRKSGTVCIVGVPARDFTVPMPYVQDWEITIQGCANYAEPDFERAIALGAQLPAARIVSAQYPLTEGPKAFKEAALGTSGKVLVHP